MAFGHCCTGIELQHVLPMLPSFPAGAGSLLTCKRSQVYIPEQLEVEDLDVPNIHSEIEVLPGLFDGRAQKM